MQSGFSQEWRYFSVSIFCVDVFSTDMIKKLLLKHHLEEGLCMQQLERMDSALQNRHGNGNCSHLSIQEAEKGGL